MSGSTAWVSPSQKRRQGSGRGHMLPVRRVHPDRAAEFPAPFHHGRVVVRVGQRDARQPAQRPDQRDRRRIQQGDAVPEDIARRRPHQQRPLVDPDRRDAADQQVGLQHPPGIAVLPCSRSSVVQCWPRAGTYCRSSSQIGQAAGGAGLSANWMLQASWQRKCGMVQPRASRVPRPPVSPAWRGRPPPAPAYRR